MAEHIISKTYDTLIARHKQFLKDAKLGAMVRKLPKGFALVRNAEIQDYDWQCGLEHFWEPGVFDPHWHKTPEEAIQCALKEAGIE